MKKLFLITALFLATASYALGQEKTMTAMLPCNNVIDVFEVLRKVDERLIFTGDTLIRESSTKQFFRAGLYVWTNLDTKTTSITIMFPDKTMCLLAPVRNFQAWSGEQPWEKPKEDL